MPEEKVTLRQSRQVNLSYASFAAYTPAVLPDGTIHVKLAIASDGEHTYRLHPGETFPVGDETWKLDHVENPSGPEWAIHLVRVK
jgi:hypothetical protein